VCPGGNECQTRKRYAFSVLMDIAASNPAGADPAGAGTGAAEAPKFSLPVPGSGGGSGGGSEGSSEGSSEGGSGGGSGGGSEQSAVEQSKAALLEIAFVYLDEYKDRAFKSAMLEPAKCYELRTGGDVVSLNCTYRPYCANM